MVAPRAVAVAVVWRLAAMGRGKDDEVGPKADQNAGPCRSTSFEDVAEANPATRVDPIPEAGAATLPTRNDSTLQPAVTELNSAHDTTTGSWRLESDLFLVTPSGMPWSLTRESTDSANHPTLSGAGEKFDFDGQGVLEAADRAMLLVS